MITEESRPVLELLQMLVVPKSAPTIRASKPISTAPIVGQTDVTPLKVLKTCDKYQGKWLATSFSQHKRTFMKTPSQPRAIFTSWRFKFKNTSAFGMRALLILYLLPTSSLMTATRSASSLYYASFSLHVTILSGGWLADRLLGSLRGGYRSSIDDAGS